MARKVLFLVPYPLNESPSQRFRFEQYLGLLEASGFKVSVQTFLSSGNWRIFFHPGKLFLKATILTIGFLKRITALLKAPSYDFVFIHREVTPIGPPIFEWILAKILRKKIIYDFDDAIWLTDLATEPAIIRTLKCRSKVGSICSWSHKVSCGNQYLATFAKRFNQHVIYNPTTIDTTNRHQPDLLKRSAPKQRVVLGWTGSHSTMKYLLLIEKVLQNIERSYPFVEVLVISDRRPDLKLKTLQFLPWSEKTEIADLQQIDIGLMPLADDEWTKGKCGFKALQYMSLKIPAIASAVGVNTYIIENGVNGFLCTDEVTWEKAIKALIANSALRQEIGEAGRNKVLIDYSVESNSSNFLSLFE